MALPILNLVELVKPKNIDVKLPDITLPDADRFVIAELPAISFEMAPALEDLAALTEGLPAGLPEQLEGLLAAQVGTAFPGAKVVGIATGEKPDYALLLTPDPSLLEPEEKERLLQETIKLLSRRQKFGIYLEPEGISGVAGRKKGTATVNEITDASAILSKTGAPFALRVYTAATLRAVNGQLAAEAPRYSLSGDECACGPVSVSAIRVEAGGGTVKAIVSAKADLLLGAAHSEFELHVTETLGVDGNGDAPGTLAKANAAVEVKVLRIAAANAPEKLRKLLERDLVKALLAVVFPRGVLLTLALRALATRIATNRAQEGEAVSGPVRDALERTLAPQMVSGTDQKVVFDITSASTPNGDIRCKGVALVVERQQRVRMRTTAVGRRVHAPAGVGQRYAVTFGAVALDMVEPVSYVWKCLGQVSKGGAEAVFTIDLAAQTEFLVNVSAKDAEGFPAPKVQLRFQIPPGTGGLIIQLKGERVAG